MLDRIRRVTIPFIQAKADRPLDDFVYVVFNKKVWYSQSKVNDLLRVPKNYLAKRSSALTKDHYRLPMKSGDSITLYRQGESYSIGTADGNPCRFLHGPSVVRYIYDHLNEYDRYPVGLNLENFRRFRILTLAHRFGLKHMHMGNTLMMNNHITQIKEESKTRFDEELKSYMAGIPPDRPSVIDPHQACQYLGLWTLEGYPHIDYLFTLLSMTEIIPEKDFSLTIDNLVQLREFCKTCDLFDLHREPFSVLERDNIDAMAFREVEA